MKIGGRTTLSRTTQTVTIADWNLINSAVRQKPNIPVTNLDGSYAAPEEQDNDLSNPLAVSRLSDKNNRKLSVRANVYATVAPVKWFNFKTEFSASINSDETHSFVPTYWFNAWSQNSEASREETMQNTYYWAWRNQMNFSYKPTKRQSINLMLGHEMTERESNRLYGKRLNGEDGSLPDLSAGDALTAENSGYTGRSAFLSFFGRLNYSLMERYLLTATLRYEGSSNFGDGHRWGCFPSVSAAWRINKEKFMKSVDWVSNLKLRAGYGHVGNSNVSQFAYTSVLKTIPTIWGNGNMLSRIPNEDITWETTKSFNVGLDIALFNNRVEFIADWYYKKTDDLLLILSLPGT